jgi:O-antigen/teichoic acid export membrane protein
MDKKKGLLNVTIAITFKLILLIGSILVRRFLIKYIGNEINGLNSLFLSIIGVLSVAELGVGSAITFCMYKPVVEGDNDKVSALYHLFTKLYLIIGGVILIGGCIVMPFLKYLAKDYQDINVNLYITFGLMLISVVLSYLFSSKTSLINAYKNNYITTLIANGGMVIQYVLQIVAIIVFRTFEAYLICRIISVAIQWGITELVSRLKYNKIINNKQSIDVETKHEVVKNIKAMFMHKIGGVLVNTADSVIISAFIGVVVLGKYSNYTTIMTSMVAVINLFFSPLTSVIGHMCVQEDNTQVVKYFNFFHTFNFILGLVFFLGYYSVIDNLVVLCFGEDDLVLTKTISFVITLNYFVQFMRQAVMLFKDATGTFYNDRWKPLVEGIINFVLSILFVVILSDEYKVVGVIVATIITNLLICHIVEPHVLYKYAFKQSAKKYYIRNYLYIVVFAVALVSLNFCMLNMENQWIQLLVNGCISIVISLVIAVIAILIDKDFRHYVKVFLNRIKAKILKKA